MFKKVGKFIAVFIATCIAGSFYIMVSISLATDFIDLGNLRPYISDSYLLVLGFVLLFIVSFVLPAFVAYLLQKKWKRQRYSLMAGLLIAMLFSVWFFYNALVPFPSCSGYI